MGLAHWSSLVYPCQSFSFTLFFRLIPWSIEAPCIHLSTGFLRPEREDVLHLHSLGRLGGHLWPLWTGQTSCLGVLLAFYVNQGISASFSPLFSYLQYSFLISLSKSSAEATFPSGSPGSCGGWTPAKPHTHFWPGRLGQRALDANDSGALAFQPCPLEIHCRPSKFSTQMRTAEECRGLTIHILTHFWKHVCPLTLSPLGVSPPQTPAWGQSLPRQQ